MAATEEQVEEKIEYQYMRCRKDYYKTMLKLVLGSLGTIIVIVGSIVLWSYGPMRDITIMKMEVRIMQEKLDIILKKNGYKKKNISEKLENKPDQTTAEGEIKIDVLNIANPALGAVCRGR